MLSQQIFLPSNEVNNKNSSDKTSSNQQKEEKGFSSILPELLMQDMTREGDIDFL